MNCKKLFASIFLPVSYGLLASHLAAVEMTYQKPDKAVLDVLHAPLPPDASVAPTHDAMILAVPVSFPPISHISKPALGLAGVRVVTSNRTIHGPYGSGQ